MSAVVSFSWLALSKPALCVAEWVRSDGNPVLLLGPGDAVTCSSHVAETSGGGLAVTAIGGLY